MAVSCGERGRDATVLLAAISGFVHGKALSGGVPGRLLRRCPAPEAGVRRRARPPPAAGAGTSGRYAGAACRAEAGPDPSSTPGRLKLSAVPAGWTTHYRSRLARTDARPEGGAFLWNAHPPADIGFYDRRRPQPCPQRLPDPPPSGRGEAWRCGARERDGRADTADGPALNPALIKPPLPRRCAQPGGAPEFEAE